MKVRDRLMHPKRAADLEVTDNEITESVRAFLWFDSQANGLMSAVIAALQVARANLTAIRADLAAKNAAVDRAIQELRMPEA